MRGADGWPGSCGGAEPGFALAAAVFALLILSALAAGAFYAAFEEVRIGRNSRAAESAFEAAEAGLSRATADGPPGGWGAMPVGDSAHFAGTLPSGTGRFSGAFLRLNGQLFLVRSTGTDAAGEGQRTVAALARLDSAGVGLAAALVAGGRVVLGRGSLLDGRDTGPPAWSGCPAAGRPSLPGLALPGAGDLEVAACGAGCVAGEPPVRADPALADAVPLQVGGADWGALARVAAKTYAAGGQGLVVVPSPSQSGAACDPSAPDNWGEPARPPVVAPCAGYLPVILVTGNLTMAGGRGQGVLLVDGDLVLTGGAEFDGLVLVRGSLRAAGAGGRIRGGVVVAVTGGALAASLEGASITYSGCALAAALRNAMPARLIPERSWSELY
ncbi:MAG: hypothetical protein ABSB58_03175 [Gemmatimonadales bacterium]